METRLPQLSIHIQHVFCFILSCPGESVEVVICAQEFPRINQESRLGHSLIFCRIQIFFSILDLVWTSPSWTRLHQCPCITTCSISQSTQEIVSQSTQASFLTPILLWPRIPCNCTYFGPNRLLYYFSFIFYLKT